MKFKIATLDDEAEPVEPANIPIHVNNESGCGIRVILGGDAKSNCADLLIERTMIGWRIIVHPGEGRDPALGVIVKDNCEVFVVEAEPLRIVQSERELSGDTCEECDKPCTDFSHHPDGAHICKECCEAKKP